MLELEHEVEQLSLDAQPEAHQAGFDPARSRLLRKIGERRELYAGTIFSKEDNQMPLPLLAAAAMIASTVVTVVQGVQMNQMMQSSQEQSQANFDQIMQSNQQYSQSSNEQLLAWRQESNQQMHAFYSAMGAQFNMPQGFWDDLFGISPTPTPTSPASGNVFYQV
ncbi:MAG: hypothetical protein AMXMBFR33_58810 [Candidatus Xenobia bacterium]